MKSFLFLTAILLFFSCEQKKEKTAVADINSLAEQYVRLGLAIGEYDGDFVDAYYGPDSLKPLPSQKLQVFPKANFLASVDELINELKPFRTDDPKDTNSIRATWITGQLIAFGRRIKIFSGETAPFDEESKDLFGVIAPSHDEAFFKQIVFQAG